MLQLMHSLNVSALERIGGNDAGRVRCCIIIIIIHEFQSDASPEELQGRCSVTVFSLWLWPVTRTAERPDKQLSLQSAPKTVDSPQRRDRRWQ